jgi:hypothetical protein
MLFRAGGTSLPLPVPHGKAFLLHMLADTFWYDTGLQPHFSLELIIKLRVSLRWIAFLIPQSKSELVLYTFQRL